MNHEPIRSSMSSYTMAITSRHRAARLAKAAVTGAIAWSALAATMPALAAQGQILHVFGTRGDGDLAASGVVVDAAGTLYGVTTEGGKNQAGTVFQVTPPASGQSKWTETVLHNFGGSSIDGQSPRSVLRLLQNGRLQGSTAEGGSFGAGTLYELRPPKFGKSSWTQEILNSFGNGSDIQGTFPATTPVPLTADRTVLYGTAQGGGAANMGLVYALQGDVQTVLHEFNGGDGALPGNQLVADKAGNLYGMSFVGDRFGLGNIYRLSPPASPGQPWGFQVLHTFTGGSDGRAPGNALFIDSRGVIWGTNASGGDQLLGNIFRLVPPALPGGSWAFEMLHSFGDAANGQSPHSGLVPDGNGGFFGTAGAGGTNNCGLVYRFLPPASEAASWTLSPLFSFAGGKGGGFPYGELALKDGVLYGTTFGSTSSDSLPCNAASVVFKLTL